MEPKKGKRKNAFSFFARERGNKRTGDGAHLSPRSKHRGQSSRNCTHVTVREEKKKKGKDRHHLHGRTFMGREGRGGGRIWEEELKHFVRAAKDCRLASSYGGRKRDLPRRLIWMEKREIRGEGACGRSDQTPPVAKRRWESRLIQ